MREMAVRSRPARVSVKASSTPGQTPAAVSARVATAQNISIDTNGSASRLVRRKCVGKLWKRIHTSGAVNNWQEIVSAIADQMRFMGPEYLPSEGNQASSAGKSVTIPSIAR